MSLPCAICSFCTRTGESHSTGFISPDASLNTAGVFIYKQKGKPIIMEWTPRPLRIFMKGDHSITSIEIG
ncbi:hypothetical protein A6578_23965 [Escherichia coli]|nr:hypothetical protein C5P38_26045 [Escherichia coli]RCR00323.1 hypothetical protein A6578_23965 [Escherichia coli]